MLLKAEKILSHGDILMNSNEAEIFRAVRHELAEKIVEGMIEKGLVKIEIAQELNEDLGALAKVRASVRAYNPDD